MQSMTEKQYEEALTTKDNLEDECKTLKNIILRSRKKHKEEIGRLSKELEDKTAEVLDSNRENDKLQRLLEEEQSTSRLLRDQVGATFVQLKEEKAKIQALEAGLAEANESCQQEKELLIAELSCDLDECVNKLQALTSVGHEVLDGQDPNVSRLLGLDPLSPDFSNRSNSFGNHSRSQVITAKSVDELKDLIGKVNVTKKSIDDMRRKLSETIADSYADTAVQNCISQ